MKDTGCATTENPATLSAIIEGIHRQINPLEHTPENDSEYRNYDKADDENKSILDLQEEKRESRNARRRKGADKETKDERSSEDHAKVPPITDLQFIHLFSKEEMDRLIHAIVFSDFISADKKVRLIRKIYSTASKYYDNPLFDRHKNELRFDSLIRAQFSEERTKCPPSQANEDLL